MTSTEAVPIETAHEDMIHDAQLDFYGKRLATCSSDRTVKIFNIVDGEPSKQAGQTLKGHAGPVWQVAWAHPKFGPILASCSYDGQVLVWREQTQGPSAGSWTKIKEHTLHTASVNSISWAPHELGAILACASSDGKLSVLTFKDDGQWVADIFNGHAIGCNAVSWAPAIHPGSLIHPYQPGAAAPAPFKRFASAGCDNLVKIWSFHEGTQTWVEEETLEGHTDWVRDVAWAPNIGLPRSYIATASQDKSVIIWTKDTPTAPWIKTSLDPSPTASQNAPGTQGKFPDVVWRVSWSLAGNILAVSCGDGKVTLWKENLKGTWECVSDSDFARFGVLSMYSSSKAERSYVQSSLLLSPPLRLDGRSSGDYRQIALETGVLPLTNGSAKVCIGHPGRGGSVQEAGGAAGGTEVLVGVRLEVAGTEEEGGGKLACTVHCSPAAYPSLNPNALDDLQADLTILLESVLSHPSLRPCNLDIIPGKKAWAVVVDAVVFSDGGNVVDCLMFACRAALWDTKVPRTTAVEYRAPPTQAVKGDAGMDIDVDGGVGMSGFETKMASSATDFELTDYWDEGEVLGGRDAWPVCVTLNVLSNMHFLDATLQEEAAVPLRMYAMYAFPGGKPTLQSFRLVGQEVSTMEQTKDLIKHAEKYARDAWTGLEAKLKDEEARRGIKAREKFYGRLR